MGDTKLSFLLRGEYSVLEQAELVRLLAGIPAAADVCDEFSQRLDRLLITAWMEQAPLQDLFAVLDAWHICRQQPLSGTQLAIIAKRLLQTEISVGGPYAADATPEIRTNAYIAACMTWLASPLPNVEVFLKNEAYQLAKKLEHHFIFEAYWDLRIVQRTQPHILLPPVPAEVRKQYAKDPRVIAITFLENQASPRDILSMPTAAAAILDQILARTAPTYQELPAELRAPAMAAYQQLLEVDKNHEISLLAYYFATSLAKEPTLPDGLLAELGAANIHTWLAYTIYDDFLDDEGQPKLLSAAHVALRQAAQIFNRLLPANHDFHRFIRSAFIAIDTANSWELSHWRFDVSSHTITVNRLPDFGDRQMLADRALLHIAGPLAVLAAQGSIQSGAIWKQAEKGLRHYLIARQLTDDLHDWKKDLRAGHITYVVSEILRRMAVPPGVYPLEALLQRAQAHFWQLYLPELCRTIEEHIHTSRAALEPIFNGPASPLLQFLDRLQATLQATLVEREQGILFLNDF